MFFVPVAILVIEDEDDRTFMENLYERFLFISILLDAVMKLLQHASITFCKYETDPILIFEATHL